MNNTWKNFISEGVAPETLKKIQDALASAGGESYIVGGAVRDSLIPGVPESKDVDFVVRKLTYEQMVKILSPLGEANFVGDQFGVVTAIIDGEEFDFALPRAKEVKTGDGHTDFDVETDPNATLDVDAERRDFTINAMYRGRDGKIYDYHNGRSDLRRGIIRAVGEPEARIKEDPLRMVRAVQFAVRFDFKIEANMMRAIRANLDLLPTISGERILMELKKAWLRGKDMKVLVDLLNSTGIGENLFGEDFDPMVIPNRDVVEQFIAYFLHGGNPKVLKLTRELVKYLDAAKIAADGRFKAFEVPKGREVLPKIINALAAHSRYAQRASYLRGALKLPLNLEELAVTGHDFASAGLRGPDIGRAIKMVLSLIDDGKIKNEKADIMGAIKDAN